MINKCVMCGYDGIEDAMVDITTTLDGVEFVRTVPAEKCPGCGEEYYRAEILHAFDLWVERQLLNDHEPFGPEQTEFVRKLNKAREIYAEKKIYTEDAAHKVYKELWGDE